MKIYMGPYPNDWLRCRIYTNYMQKKYGYNWDEPTNRFERFLEKLDDFVQDFYNVTINQILKHRKRKVKIHIDRYDTWGMDHTLALIILPMLKQLKETKHGSPDTDAEDVPENLRPDPNRVKLSEEGKVEHWDVDNTVHERWDWILGEMIYAFEAEADEDYEQKFRSGVHDVEWVKTEGSKYYEMKRGPNDTYHFDREAYDKDFARRKNGLRLFAKYYHGLWD